MTPSPTLRLGAPAASVMWGSPAFREVLYDVLWGGRAAQRHVGAGQMRAILRSPSVQPPTGLRRGISRQVDRQIGRIEFKQLPRSA